MPIDPEETRFLPPGGMPAGDDETRFAPPEGTTSDPEVTRLVTTEPASPDDEATRFVDPVADALVDPEVTRLEVSPAHPAASADSEETRFVEPSATQRAGSRPPEPARPATRGRSRIGARPKDGDTGPLEVGQAFSNRYHIIRVLGIGGMGAVYHAWDAELGMAVALKVIRPESTADPAAAREMERRFKQELVLARQVTHKNVVRIHDLGEVDGIKYITMPYLEGSDLATVLKEKGKMPVAEALVIVRDVAAGLTAAHEAGIVHRDLKPANIMVLKDRAVIMDFGIARSSKLPSESSAHLAPSAALDALKSMPAATMAGTILGTVQYMAPEQAKAQPVDQRADIYALGLIFLDMLLGKRHTHAASAIEELKSRIEQPPPLAQTIDPTIPKPIEQIIAKCLQPDREQRYQTSAELVAALDRVDDKGELIPVKRTIRLPYAIAAVVLLLGTSVGVWWYQRQFIPPPVHDPVSIIVADFQNNTGDMTLDRTLEPVIRLALEGANFISVYDRSTIRRGLGVPAPATLDERSAQELAVRQGVGVVMSGTVARESRGYKLSVKAVRSATGEVIASADDRAADKNKILAVAADLAGEVRKALGDDTSDDARRFAMATWTASSIEVVHEFAMASVALSNTKYDEARQGFQKTIELDKDFGPAYVSLAVLAMGQDRQQEAQKYMEQALSHLARMTERERFAARGFFYLVTGDYQACTKEYNDLITRFERDVAARNNLAICSAQIRDLPKSVAVMRESVQILPKRSLYHTNLSFYAAYASDFQTAEQEALTAQKLESRWALLNLAFAKLGQGQVMQAADAYERLAKVDELGVSESAVGLGDIAMYEGRFSDAVKILEQGTESDLQAKNQERAADKFIAIAVAQLARGQQRAATAAAQRALMLKQAVKTRFMAARIFEETGDLKTAQGLRDELAKDRLAEPRAYARILEGDVFLKNGDPNQAIAAFTDANKLLDTWIGHFDLGRAYLEAGRVAQKSGQLAEVAVLYAQADSEFDRCLKRRGEAISLFLDNEPTYGFLPAVHYYQGLAREGLKTTGFAESYRAYLDIRGKSSEDPLVRDARKRAGA